MNNIDDTQKPSRISAIVAIGKNRGIGKANELLWRIPEDLKRVRALTQHHPIIMGRKTWESIPEKFRPLPNRTNIVVTRQNGYVAQGATVVSSLDEALAAARSAAGSDEIFIFGGAQLYSEALPFTTRLYLTLIDAEKEADSFFPEYETEFTKVLSSETHDHEGLSYEWRTLERA